MPSPRNQCDASAGWPSAEAGRRCRSLRAIWAGLVRAAALARLRTAAHAACNIIPPALPTFRSQLGSTDRPFARPGDSVRLRLDPACHGTSAGFLGPTRDQVVTVVFTPPGGPSNVVALTMDCTAVDVAA